MREAGRPWEIGKAFDYSAPVGPVYPVSRVGHVNEGEIRLELDGQVKQKSDISHLIWSVPEIIANLSTLFELQPGDLILSGTPEGVGAAKPGQAMVGEIAGLGAIRVNIE
jgi:fumarylpyruvate hydrolase